MLTVQQLIAQLSDPDIDPDTPIMIMDRGGEEIEPSRWIIEDDMSAEHVIYLVPAH